MSVYIEKTESPNIIKFINDEFLTKDSFEFSSAEQAALISPLCSQLLSFPMIKRTYITANIIALEKTETVKWETVLEELKDIINTAIEEKRVITQKKMPVAVSVYTEMTPNPEVMKYVANRMLWDGILEFKNKEQANASPIAKALFELPFVKQLFITENYISITKNNTVQWSEVNPEVREKIAYLLKQGVAIFQTEASFDQFEKQNNTKPRAKNYTKEEKEIKALLDQYVKPAVAADGGNIELIEYIPDTKTVQLLLQGACSGCPSSVITLKNGIESMLREFLPEKVETVEAINQ